MYNIIKPYQYQYYLPYGLPPIDYNIPTLSSLFTAAMIIIGMIFISKLLWMLIYQLKYGGDAGDEYLTHGKTFVKNKYMRKVP